MDRMYELGPEFIDVTWGAGGSTSATTLEICTTAARHLGLETCMHLTCTNMQRETVDHALKVCRDNGIQNILALRGDPPKGQERWTAIEGGFSHAVDLVRYIRSTHGDYFGISVAGYPEGHIDSDSFDTDMQHLKEKVDAGADYIVTQLFYDVDIFLAFVRKCREIGITVPIVPGIMPLHTYAGWKRMTSLCKTIVPDHMANALEQIKDDDEAVKAYGERYCIEMILRIQAEGINCFHFYTLNLEASVKRILEALRFDPTLEKIRPLPWKQVHDGGIICALSRWLPHAYRGQCLPIWGLSSLLMSFLLHIFPPLPFPFPFIPFSISLILLHFPRFTPFLLSIFPRFSVAVASLAPPLTLFPFA